MARYAVFSKITDHLYLTGVKGITAENFEKYGITCCINITQERDQHPHGFDCLHIKLDDEPNSNISEHFDVAADKIHEVSQNGGNIVVHCTAGMSRSVTLVLAYLIKYHNMNLHDAFNYVHERRTIIRPNNGFFQQLMAFEMKIHGKESIAMVYVKHDRYKMQVPDFFVSEHPDVIKSDFESALKDLE